MKVDYEEQKIKALFQQLKQADERLVRPFEADLNAARAQHRRPRTRVLFGFAAAAVALAIAIGSWTVLRRTRTVVEPQPPSSDAATLRLEPPAEPAIPPGPPIVAPPRVHNYSLPVHRSTRRRPQAAALISQWSSPTGFLLNTPVKNFLQRLPRLDDSFVRLKSPDSIDQN